MKKIVSTLILIVCLTSCSSTFGIAGKSSKNVPAPTFSGQIDQKQTNFLKKNYPWTAGKILTVNYTQPGAFCHFDNSQISKESKKWWNKFYSKIDMTGATGIYVYSDGKAVKEHADNKTYFADAEDFLLNNFFARKISCFGILLVNESGEYLQFNGHYSEKQVSEYLARLQ